MKLSGVSDRLLKEVSCGAVRSCQLTVLDNSATSKQDMPERKPGCEPRIGLDDIRHARTDRVLRSQWIDNSYVCIHAGTDGSFSAVDAGAESRVGREPGCELCGRPVWIVFPKPPDEVWKGPDACDSVGNHPDVAKVPVVLVGAPEGTVIGGEEVDGTVASECPESLAIPSQGRRAEPPVTVLPGEPVFIEPEVLRTRLEGDVLKSPGVAEHPRGAHGRDVDDVKGHVGTPGQFQEGLDGRDLGAFGPQASMNGGVPQLEWGRLRHR
jgi:hypothetical protein